MKATDKAGKEAGTKNSENIPLLILAVCKTHNAYDASKCPGSPVESDR